MIGHESQQSIDEAAGILGRIRARGVRIWLQDDQLCYSAPKGALTHEDAQRLRASKLELVALLQGSRDATAAVQARLQTQPQVSHAPLTFSQLAWWRKFRLSERRSMRHVACATRLRGRLNLEALRTSVRETFQRHATLRTRIVVIDGSPMQEIAESSREALEMHDLSGLPESARDERVTQLIEEHLKQSIDLTADEVVGVMLLRLSSDEHLLIVSMDHIVSDASSMRILLRDLFASYVGAVRRRSPSLPAVAVQFPEYAIWQQSVVASWKEKHGTVWADLAGSPRVRFPVGAGSCAARRGWGTVPLRIGRELKAELREWSRTRRTTIAMSMLTAYVALVMRWCDVPEMIVPYQTNGRSGPEVENTVGFFASLIYLRVKLLGSDTCDDLKNRVMEEYCRAHECADYSYLESRQPPPPMVHNTVFNWVPQGCGIDLSDLDGSPEALTLSAVPIPNAVLETLEWDNEPAILLFDGDDEITGGVHFSLERLPVEAMERFGRNFLLFVEKVMREPTARVTQIALAK